MSIKFTVQAGLFLGIATLYACSSVDSDSTVYSGSEQPQDNSQIEDPATGQEAMNPIVRARIIADILYDAKYAFDDNKLQVPAGDNAYDRYLEVLSFDPGNAVAIEGIKEIVLRYVELADSAMGIGKYDNAESLLGRGASIDSASNDILAALSRLTEARKVEVEFIELDPQGLQQQSIETLVRLAEIAEHVRSLEATFLITARNDDEGRWIYKVMRESVGGFRLRGNIALGSEPGIQINSPSS